MYGYIYKTVNLVNGKIYIGQHKAEKFEPENYIGSGQKLQAAIKKYGLDNFKQELLIEAQTKNELNELEITFIEIFNATDPAIGYNIAAGGEGGNLGEQVNKKISEAGKNKCFIHKESKILRIDKQYLTLYLQEGWIRGFGPMSEEHKKNLSKSRKEKNSAKGEKNPMYGNGYKIAGSKNGRAKKVLCVELNKIYATTMEAAADLNIRAGGIQDAARGVQKTSGGYTWRYIDD